MSDVLPQGPKLPPELLRIVKEHIPTADLRTHVCYYNTCRDVASFYGTEEQQEEFWKKSCSLCGICLVKDTSWKNVAFECISKDGFCRHPACGGALLDWNAAQVAKAIEEIPEWDPEEVLDVEVLCQDPDTGEYNENLLEPYTFTAHKIFESMGFSASGTKEANDVHLDGFLHSATSVNKRSPLYDHPIAWRSLAVFPSLVNVRYYGLGIDDSEVRPREGPVTVWAIYKQIRRDMAVGSMNYKDVIDMAKHQYPFLLNHEDQLKPIRTSDSGKSVTCEDDGVKKQYREVWSRCLVKFEARPGLVPPDFAPPVNFVVSMFQADSEL